MKSLLFFLFLLFFSSPFCNYEDTLDLIWIEVASGERQCIPPTFASLDEAIDQLTANNIEVFDQNEINFIVCAECSCPTGTVYLAQISDSDFEDAEVLGWVVANDYEE